MLHQREGFAPIPKTQVINIGGDVNQDNSIGKGSVSVGALAAIHTDMGRITDRFNARLGVADQKLLEVGDANDSEDGIGAGSVDDGNISGGFRPDRVIDAMAEEVVGDDCGNEDLEDVPEDTEDEFGG
jgi:hypothetical protein